MSTNANNFLPKISIKQFWRLCRQTANLMVGQGDYQNYLAHMHTHHPEVVPMNEVEFFRHHQNTRYPQAHGKANINRCPC